MRYNELDKMLKGQNYLSKKAGNNTYWKRRGEDIALLYHSTDVATFRPNGDIILDNGGWFTSTTKERIGWALTGTQFGIYQGNGVWYIVKCIDGRLWNKANPTYRYNNGMVLHTLADSVTGYLPDTPKADKLLKKQVREYTQKCADAMPLDQPGPGDCWYCAMVTTEGQTLGDANQNSDHLLSHIKEGYIVPSLINNALKQYYNAPMAFWQAFKGTGYNGDNRDFGRQAVKRAVYRYILHRMGFSV